MSGLHSLLGLSLAGAGAVGIGAAAGALSPALASGLCLASLAGLLGGVALGSARPELQWFGPAVLRGQHPGRVALTLDDGPDPVSTPAILRALEPVGRATFFVLADRVARDPGLLRQIVAAGHEVGLHGLSHHPWLTLRAPKAGAAELQQGLDILAAAGATGVRFFRPPFGVVSPRVYEAARRAGLEVAWCSLRTGDGVALPKDTLLARCRRAQGGDVVLLHEGDRPTWRLMPEILAEWQGRGLEVSTLSEALEAPGAAA